MSAVDTILKKSGRLLRGLSLLMTALGGGAILLLLGLVCANIVLRPLGHSIRGTLELSAYLCALGVGLCLPGAQVAGSHISAGLWASALPRAVNRFSAPLCSLLCACVLLLAGRDLLSMSEYVWMMGDRIDGFRFSYYGLIAAFAAGVLLHALIFLHGALGAVFLPAGYAELERPTTEISPPETRPVSGEAAA